MDNSAAQSTDAIPLGEQAGFGWMPSIPDHWITQPDQLLGTRVAGRRNMSVAEPSSNAAKTMVPHSDKVGTTFATVRLDVAVAAAPKPSELRAEVVLTRTPGAVALTFTEMPQTSLAARVTPLTLITFDPATAVIVL